MIWFTADTHFNHRNIIKYECRPFDSVEEMNEALIENWNNTVKPTDAVYHLGDFAFSKNPDQFLSRLNGHKRLIIGNHDSAATIESEHWAGVYDTLEIIVDNTLVVMSHYAHRVWNRSHHGSIMLYGHSHGNLPGSSQSLDVGVDAKWDYKPINIYQIKDRLATLPAYKQEDHHIKER